MCKNQQLHSHKHIVYDEHHNLQTTTLLRYDNNKIFNNINIVKIEDFNVLYDVYKKILPFEIAKKAQQIHQDVVLSRKFSNATLLSSSSSNETLSDMQTSVYHYKQRDTMNALNGPNSMLSQECKELIQDIYSLDFAFLNYDI